MSNKWGLNMVGADKQGEVATGSEYRSSDWT
jgi:hypothetical protein